MSLLSITVPSTFTSTEPFMTVSFVPAGTPVFVGPGLPGGSGTVGDTVGFGVGFGLVVGVPSEGEADDEEEVADDADADEGAVDEPGTSEPGVLETDDDVPGSEEAGADELAGGSDCAEPTLLAGSRSMTAATISPPSNTSTSDTTTTRSRTEPNRALA